MIMNVLATNKHTEGKSYLIIYKKGGKFYDVFGEDAFIINYLFDYKLLPTDKRTKNYKCGFPDVSFNKVINALDDNKISYQVIYNDKNPLIKDFKNKSRYNEFKMAAIKKQDIKTKMDLLVSKISSIDDIDKLTMIMEKVEECLE